MLDSTPLYDAVATMDTITLIRSAMRGLLAVAVEELETQQRAVCSSGDDYASSAKPQIDWEDPAAREALIDSRARDAHACLALLDGMELGPEVVQAATLLARVAGQDLETGEDGGFRIARRMAPNRIISTVDPEARHGHKTQARGFDGYKGHIALDPDHEVITATAVTAGNIAAGAAAEALLADCLDAEGGATAAAAEVPAADGEPTEVYGDCAYGTGKVLKRLEQAEIVAMVKVQPAQAPAGHFTKEQFTIDLARRTVTCPNAITVEIQMRADGSGLAAFGTGCGSGPLVARCTSNANGRTITVSAYEAQLATARQRQQDPSWGERYRAHRPKVERKLGHMMRRRHGGRRARGRGRGRVAQDFAWLAAAINLARLAVLGVTSACGAGAALARS